MLPPIARVVLSSYLLGVAFLALGARPSAGRAVPTFAPSCSPLNPPPRGETCYAFTSYPYVNLNSETTTEAFCVMEQMTTTCLGEVVVSNVLMIVGPDSGATFTCTPTTYISMTCSGLPLTTTCGPTTSAKYASIAMDHTCVTGVDLAPTTNFGTVNYLTTNNYGIESSSSLCLKCPAIPPTFQPIPADIKKPTKRPVMAPPTKHKKKHGHG